MMCDPDPFNNIRRISGAHFDFDSRSPHPSVRVEQLNDATTAKGDEDGRSGRADEEIERKRSKG